MGVCAYIAGALFAAGWWAFVDGIVEADAGTMTFVMWIPGILGTLSFFMLNMMTPANLSEGNFLEQGKQQMAKVWFFVAALIGFISMVVAIWVMLATASLESQPWPGASMIVQSVLLLIGSITFFWGRRQVTEDGI